MLIGCGCGGIFELIFVALAGGATAGGVVAAFKATVEQLLTRRSNKCNSDT